MKIVKSPEQISLILDNLREKNKSIGFIPTMGCLHDGHLSLIKRACEQNDIVVVSIFVNPTQFGPKEDYKKYPQNLKQDIRLANDAGCDIIFYPSVKAMYPRGYASYVSANGLTSVMCGRSRPGHFKGVTTICAKLFNIIKPDAAYFGQKDYQQSLIIKRMIEDLNMGLKIKVLPVVRERDGLAMSSRNKCLNPGQREDALVLYAALREAKSLIRSGIRKSLNIKNSMRAMILEREGIHIDYITIADPNTLREKKKIDSRVLVALAVYIGRTRLIDNIII